MAKKSQFWNSQLIEPKRSFRWMLTLNNIDTYLIKTSGKPTMTVGEISHSFMAHTFHYPGKITWNKLDVTLVDPVFPDATAIIVKTLQASGYALPATDVAARTSLSKSNSVNALGQPRITGLDANGKTIERWTLYNAWIQDTNFGTLSYDEDSMVGLSITLKYDWAEYEGAPQSPENPIPVPIMTTGQPQLATIEKYRKELGAV
jgi:hypothetical protein